MASSRGSTETQSFDVTTAFTSLSLLVILTAPLSSLFQFVPMFLGAVNCLGRIQTFIQSAAHSDPRFQGLPSKSSPDSETSYELATIPKKRGLASSHSAAVESAFTIGSGEFGWKSGQPVLRVVDTITIAQSRFTLVTGPSASGKSTLCKVLLGEVAQSGGVVRLGPTSGNIAFCDQTPYLTNATVRDTIIGCADIDEAWYKRVLYAVDLCTDLPTLEKSDRTMAGNNGEALSTGQRQRIALARALYARKPVVILDDVFAGMDNVTTKRIFTRLFSSSGILRSGQATVVLTSHSPDPRLPVDCLIKLRPGEPPILEQLRPETDTSCDEDSLDRPKDVMDILNLPDKGQTPDQKDTQGRKLALAEPNDWKTYKYFANAVGLPTTVVMIFLGAAFGVLYVFPSVWVDWWTTDSSSKNDFYLGIYALLQASAFACWFLFTRHCLNTLVLRSGTRLHEKLLSTLLSASMPYLSSQDSGTLINRFSQDLQLVDGELPAALLNTIATLFIAITELALVASASPWTAISYSVLFPIMYCVQKFYVQTSQRLRPLDLELKSPL